MKIIAKFGFGVVVFYLTYLLWGCAGIIPGDLFLGNPLTHAPTYPKEQEATVLEPFRIRITKCYCTNQIFKTGYEAFANLPESFRKQEEANYTAKPSAVFLVAEFSIVNSARTPMTFNVQHPPIFLLENAQGSEFADNQQLLGMEDLTVKALGASGIINPGTVLTGKKVFDAPKGDYLMAVSVGSFGSSTTYGKGSTIFKSILKPMEGQ